MKISSNYIEQNLKYYFDISRVNQDAYSNNWNRYLDGYYSFMAADGAPSKWSQVTAFFDNSDGVFDMVP